MHMQNNAKLPSVLLELQAEAAFPMSAVLLAANLCFSIYAYNNKLPTLKITSSHIMSKSLCQLGFRLCANFCTAATSLARQGDAPMISPGLMLTHHICFPAPPAYPSTHFTLRFFLYACWCCSLQGHQDWGCPSPLALERLHHRLLHC